MSSHHLAKEHDTMTRPGPGLDLGPVGVTLTSGPWERLLGVAPELEAMGYSAIWVSGGQISDLGRLADVVRATEKIPVGPAIIPVVRHPAEAVATLYTQLHTTNPDRLIVGLGGAHGPRPLQIMGDYLDHLDTVPPTVPAARRVLAALGPRMLQLARDRAAGALPLLMTPTATVQARTALGPDATLIVQLCAVLDTDPARARQAARNVIGFLRDVTGYRLHLRRLGFSEDDITQLSDHMVDALVAWGDPGAVTARVTEHLAAGADQVALTVLPSGSRDTVRPEEWRDLADALLPEPPG
jgi:probable F420-dependent oxidoreductase